MKTSIYFHIGNGGVKFSVNDTSCGPCVTVEASHFGHPTAKTGVYITQQGLQALANFFGEQALRKFDNQPYCCAARTVCERKK